MKKRILLAAAAFHDSSRNGEDGNVEHALEGAKTAKDEAIYRYYSKNY